MKIKSVDYVLLQFEMLELNQLDRALLPCPLLLDQQSYLPDTVELTEDIAAREYWLECFTKGVHKVLIHCKIKMKYILLRLTFIILIWYYQYGLNLSLIHHKIVLFCKYSV